MKDASFNYVRTFRLRPELTEDDLAFLLSRDAHSVVSKIEMGRRLPNIEDVLALQVLFRQEPRVLFPGLYDVVEDEVMRRAKALLDELAGKQDHRSAKKREFLEGLARPEDKTEHAG